MNFVKETYLKLARAFLVITHHNFKKYDQKLSINVIGVI